MTNPLLDDIDLCKWVAEELPIKFIGDPALSSVCTPFTNDEFGGQEMQSLAQQLLDTLSKYRAKAGMGRGLAANQIGILRRMIVVWLDDQPEIMVNPQLLTTEGSGSYWESCISSGSLIIGEVIRPWKGTFEFQDLQGVTHTLEATEGQTRLLLHEIDHLNGEHCMDKYEKGTVRFITGGKDEVFGYELKKLE